MKTLIKAVLLSGGIGITSVAGAQVTNIATLDTLEAIANSKALNAAGKAIDNQFSGNAATIQQKQQQLDPLITRMDANKDGSVDGKEFAAAQKSKVASLKQAAAQADALRKEIQALNQPETIARMYALEQLLLRFNAVQNKVVADKRIGAILAPSVFIYSPPAADITAAVTAELDRSVPTVPTTPPANWRPQQQTVEAMEQLVQLGQARAYAAAVQNARQQQQQQGAAAQPARSTQPAVRPVTPAPATTPPAQQPSGR